MAELRQLHIWLFDKAGHWTEPEVLRKKKDKDGIVKMLPSNGKRIVLEPETESLAGLKIQIAREVTRWIKTGKLESYYVVAVAETKDGDPAYRTIIPKTVVV